MNITDFVKDNDVLALLRELCAIPAPSHHEDKRAEFCRNWLRDIGYEDAYIDEAKNVICPINCEGKNDITVFCAHTDTVFPDTEPMPMTETEDKLFCPGVGDDTASLAVLLMAAKYIKQSGFVPAKGLLIVCNSCEEGLGNLLGTKTYMRQYADRIGRFVSFDSLIDEIATECVGSHRYKVTAKTQGGHSFAAFGNKNAIAVLAEIVQKIYQIEVPVSGNSKTTYNVGIIEGGTSVNTIAQQASMLCEYRSDNVDCITEMKNRFLKIFEESRSDEAEVEVDLIGDRPCADGVNEDEQARLADACRDIIGSVMNCDVRYLSMSTDCNIPLSLGIPAVAVGVYMGGGQHTREEWVCKDSLQPGLEIGIRMICRLSGDEY